MTVDKVFNVWADVFTELGEKNLGFFVRKLSHFWESLNSFLFRFLLPCYVIMQNKDWFLDFLKMSMEVPEIVRKR